MLQSIHASELAIENALDNVDDVSLMKDTLNRSLGWLKQVSREGRATLDFLYENATEISNLAEALRYAAHDCLRTRNMFFSLVVVGEPIRLRPIIQNEVYRIGHEAVRNASEHSHGKRLDITLAYGGQFELRVKDDGNGFNPHHRHGVKNGHFGIKAMQERTSKIGGTVVWESLPQSGTTVRLTLPGELAYEPNVSSFEDQGR